MATTSLKDVKDIDRFFDAFGDKASSHLTEDDEPQQQPVEDARRASDDRRNRVRWEEDLKNDGIEDKFPGSETAPASTCTSFKPLSISDDNESEVDWAKEQPLVEGMRLPPAEGMDTYRGRLWREKGKWKKKWSQEWFLLQHGVLITCTKEEPFLVKLCIPLKNIQAIELNSKNRNVFEVQYIAAARKGKERFALMRCKAASTPEAQEWVETLKRFRMEALRAATQMVQQVVARDRAEAAIAELHDAMKSSGIFQLASRLAGVVKTANYENTLCAWYNFRLHTLYSRIASDHERFRHDLDLAATEIENAKNSGAIGEARARKLLTAGRFLSKLNMLINQTQILALLQFKRNADWKVMQNINEGLYSVITNAIVVEHQFIARAQIRLAKERLAYALQCSYLRNVGTAFHAMNTWGKFVSARRKMQQIAFRQLIERKCDTQKKLQLFGFSHLRSEAHKRSVLINKLKLFFVHRHRDALAVGYRGLLSATYERNQKDFRAIRILQAIIERRHKLNQAIALSRLAINVESSMVLEACQVAANADWVNQELCLGHQQVPRERACFHLAAATNKIMVNRLCWSMYLLRRHLSHQRTLLRHSAVAARLLTRLTRQRLAGGLRVLARNALLTTKSESLKSYGTRRLALVLDNTVRRSLYRAFNLILISMPHTGQTPNIVTTILPSSSSTEQHLSPSNNNPRQASLNMMPPSPLASSNVLSSGSGTPGVSYQRPRAPSFGAQSSSVRGDESPLVPYFPHQQLTFAPNQELSSGTLLNHPISMMINILQRTVSRTLGSAVLALQKNAAEIDLIRILSRAQRLENLGNMALRYSKLALAWGFFRWRMAIVPQYYHNSPQTPVLLLNESYDIPTRVASTSRVLERHSQENHRRASTGNLMSRDVVEFVPPVIPPVIKRPPPLVRPPRLFNDDYTPLVMRLPEADHKSAVNAGRSYCLCSPTRRRLKRKMMVERGLRRPDTGRFALNRAALRRLKKSVNKSKEETNNLRLLLMSDSVFGDNAPYYDNYRRSISTVGSSTLSSFEDAPRTPKALADPLLDPFLFEKREKWRPIARIPRGKTLKAVNRYYYGSASSEDSSTTGRGYLDLLLLSEEKGLWQLPEAY